MTTREQAAEIVTRIHPSQLPDTSVRTQLAKDIESALDYDVEISRLEWEVHEKAIAWREALTKDVSPNGERLPTVHAIHPIDRGIADLVFAVDTLIAAREKAENENT